MRRLIKISAYSIISVVAVLLIAAVALYVRLSQGPVALDFMRDTIERQINANIAGMAVSIGGAVVERAGDTGVPHFRLRNLELKDDKGNLIARAPRAAIGINEDALFKGEIVPTSLELIGPRIRVMRSIDGAIELGFGEAAPENETVTVDAAPDTSGKTDQENAAAPAVDTATGTAALINVLSGGTPDGSPSSGTALGAIETIRIAKAEIKFYDEANDSIWSIPEAELVFQRMPYGFAVASKAEVSNGAEAGTWHADMSASYRRETHSFGVSLRINDLVPANISDEIFALSQLARVKVPLSGQVEMEVTDAGLVTRASAEFSAAAGEVGLPDYLAEPIIVDEGALRADYDPVTGSIIITDSSLLVGNSRAQLQGNVQPMRDPDGRLTALKIALKARNVAVDAQGANASPVAIDRVDFLGTAAIDDARFDIEDLVVMSGNAGIRLRGSITGGEQSPGILLSGRIRDLSAGLMRKLWPPIMAPKTRAWINENIHDGRITDGEFVVNLPVDALAEAQKSKRLPQGAVNLSFKMADVSTSYLKDLPPLTHASGEAKLVDNDFFLNVDQAGVELASGRTGQLGPSTMVARDILAVETMSEFNLDVRAEAQALIEYLSHPVLNVIKNSGFDTTKLSGDTQMKVKLSLPLIKDVPKDRVVVDASAHISKAALKEALPGIDISEGEIDLTVDQGVLKAQGPAKIAGIPAKLTWLRAAGEGAKQSATIETELDGEQRRRIGIDLGTFVRGPLGIKAVLPDLGDPQGRIDITADLAEADMRIQPINWYRPATIKTNATLTYFSKGEQGRRVENLVVKGPGLSIKGNIKLGPKNQGFRQADFSEVRLSDQNIFALSLKASDDETAVVLKGDSFDARPLIRGMFGSKGQGDAQPPQQPEEETKPVSITLSLDRIYANRDEIISGVSGTLVARSGKLQAAQISGTFLSGQPVEFRVTPVPGGREMRITGRDGGAAIRAANLYSKIAGGRIEFYALLDAAGSVNKGQLVLKNFQVRNEAALAELDRKGRPKRDEKAKDVMTFSRLTLPFTSDPKFIRIGESLVSGTELGAVAEGSIRKSDGAVQISGTFIPMYGLNSALSGIPLLGPIVSGGKGQGIIGLTFRLSGTVDKPAYELNPISAVAPGFLRKIFEYSNGNSTPAPQQNGKAVENN